jgi:hypothetical protein
MRSTDHPGLPDRQQHLIGGTWPCNPACVSAVRIGRQLARRARRAPGRPAAPRQDAAARKPRLPFRGAHGSCGVRISPRTVRPAEGAAETGRPESVVEGVENHAV